LTVNFLALLKQAKGLSGLLLATWGVYALNLLKVADEPVRTVGLWVGLFAMLVGVLIALFQLIRSLFEK
jgi:hypothetical protein